MSKDRYDYGDDEICCLYREAKDKSKQINILAELKTTKQTDIKRILVKNGETLEKRDIRKLQRRMNSLEEKIREYKEEYDEIADALSGGKRRLKEKRG